MDRQALLLYLQNVRDLEVERYRLQRESGALKEKYQPKIDSIDVEPDLKQVPRYEKEISELFRFSCAAVALFIIVILWLIGKSFSSGVPINFPLVVFLIIMILIFAVVAIALRPETEDQFYTRNSEEIQRIKDYNIQQETQALQAATRQEQFRLEWQKEDKALQNAFQQANDILAGFYSMNIIPNQYRNLASMIYIYDYMSSSQASFEDTLMHEHMENGIQRLEARLDQVIGGLDRIVYETRCLREENRAAVERVIAQNNHMLDVLKDSAASSKEAAEYAELTSNYAKANAYFSLANYLSNNDL